MYNLLRFVSNLDTKILAFKIFYSTYLLTCQHAYIRSRFH